MKDVIQRGMVIGGVVLNLAACSGKLASETSVPCTQPDRTKDSERLAEWEERYAQGYVNTSIEGLFGGNLIIMHTGEITVDKERFKQFFHWTQSGLQNAVDGKFQNLDPEMLASYIPAYSPKLEEDSILLLNTSGVSAVLEPQYLDVASEGTLPRAPEGEFTEVIVNLTEPAHNILIPFVYGLTHQALDPIPSGTCYEGESFSGINASESFAGALHAVMYFYGNNVTLDIINNPPYEKYAQWASDKTILLPNGVKLQTPIVDEETFRAYAAIHKELLQGNTPILINE